MLLPYARNTTYVDGATAVNPNDLNAIEDCLVGGKHPLFEFPVPAAAFVRTSGTMTFNLIDGVITFGGVSASTTISAQLDRLRVGQRIKSITFEYNRGGAGSIVLELVKKTGTTTTVIATTTIAAGTGVTTTSLVCNYTVQADHQIYLVVAPNNTANVFYRASAFVDNPLDKAA